MTDDKYARVLMLYVRALAINAEIEGMKAENKSRVILGHSMAYQEGSFQAAAYDLRQISDKISEMF